MKQLPRGHAAAGALSWDSNPDLSGSIARATSSGIPTEASSTQKSEVCPGNTEKELETTYPSVKISWNSPPLPGNLLHIVFATP